MVAPKPGSPVHILIHMDGHLSARKEEDHFCLTEFEERARMETEKKQIPLGKANMGGWIILGGSRV